jgi:di/tricarboxylate transporter
MHPILPDPAIQALLLVGLALILFVSNRIRHDVVAVLVLIAVAALGLVSGERLFTGFGHPAVITVAAVLLLSTGLQEAGAIRLLASGVNRFTGRQTTHLLFLVAICTLASVFMNNVGALALLMPVAIATSLEKDRPPALFLMPLAFGSLLGGMTTLIGTPPNLIVSAYREQALGEPYRMFDFSPVGVPVVLAGALFLVFLGWRLIPKARMTTAAGRKLVEIDDYVIELVVNEDSDLAGKPLKAFPGFDEGQLDILGIRRQELPVQPFRYQRIEAGDVLIVQADPKDLEGVISSGQVSFAQGDKPLRLDEYDWEDVALVEAIVEPDSLLIGQLVRNFSSRVNQGAVVVALARRNQVIRTRLQSLHFAPGDILLIQGESETVNRLFKRYGLLPIQERGLSVAEKRRTYLAISIFLAAIVAASLGLLPTTVAFVAACAALVLLRILPLQKVYSGIDWSVVVLLGAMFPLGMALEETGASRLVAEQVLSLAQGWPVWGGLALFLVVTMVLSDVINNAATALLMAPIALSTAQHLEASQDAFLMAVAVGASCAFLTPVGHQSNTLVMGPGGYRFTDYWRVGLPLELLIAGLAIPLIVVVWGVA